MKRQRASIGLHLRACLRSPVAVQMQLHTLNSRFFSHDKPDRESARRFDARHNSHDVNSHKRSRCVTVKFHSCDRYKPPTMVNDVIRTLMTCPNITCDLSYRAWVQPPPSRIVRVDLPVLAAALTRSNSTSKRLITEAEISHVWEAHPCGARAFFNTCDADRSVVDARSPTAARSSTDGACGSSRSRHGLRPALRQLSRVDGHRPAGDSPRGLFVRVSAMGSSVLIRRNAGCQELCGTSR
jgi:hypothetical protein